MSQKNVPILGSLQDTIPPQRPKFGDGIHLRVGNTLSVWNKIEVFYQGYKKHFLEELSTIVKKNSSDASSYIMEDDNNNEVFQGILNETELVKFTQPPQLQKAGQNIHSRKESTPSIMFIIRQQHGL